MLMPETLPPDLQKYNSISTQEELLELLKENTSAAVAFFMAASDDETWSERHITFMSHLVSFLQEQLLWHEMNQKLAYKVAKVMQAKRAFFKPLLKLNITCIMHDFAQPISSFLFQAISEPFFHLIRRECSAKQSSVFTVKTLRRADFKILEEFIYTGESSVLWQIDSKEAFSVIKLAFTWGLPELGFECERILLRDLDEENVFDRLAQAYHYPLERLKEACFDLINQRQTEVRLSTKEARTLSFELKEATENAIGLLKALQNYVTELICGPKVIEEEQALLIAESCPKLIALDLSQSENYHDNLKILSGKIQELNLSSCIWLNDGYLKKIVSLFPSTASLNLSANAQLSAWGELVKLRSLRTLSIARCSQVGDLELLLMLRSARTLEVLDLSECRSLTGRGFYSLAGCACPITSLNLGRTQLDDGALLELAARLSRLMHLDLTRCQFITEEGVIEAVRLLPALHTLNVSQTNLSAAALTVISQQRPDLEITI